MNHDIPLPKPPWVRVRMASGESTSRVKALMRAGSLHTVCEEARCPNVAECWGCGTATFLILGDVCTRRCGFCAVKLGRPPAGADPDEPARVAEAVAAMELKHVVVTSVTRDDLSDGGARHFADTLEALRHGAPACTFEVLVPDFQGSPESLKTVKEARPHILAHNMETVSRLYAQARPQAHYERSLHVLKMAKDFQGTRLTKSGFMVGLGESWEEVLDLMAHVRGTGCDILTIGQYLRPTRAHLPVVRYYTPEEFAALKTAALELGFRWAESGPLVRSSYHAEAQARELCF